MHWLSSKAPPSASLGAAHRSCASLRPASVQEAPLQCSANSNTALLCFCKELWSSRRSHLLTHPQ